jgi:hypothetical protein
MGLRNLGFRRRFALYIKNAQKTKSPLRVLRVTLFSFPETLTRRRGEIRGVSVIPLRKQGFRRRFAL